MKKFLNNLKERFKKAMYAFFKEEINNYVGVMDRSIGFLPPRDVVINRSQIPTKELTFAVQIDERAMSSGMGNNFSAMVERAKESLIREIIEGDYIKIDTQPLISSQYYGRHEIRASVYVGKKS